MRLCTIITLLLFCSSAFAQKDSLGDFDIYRNAVQSTLNPALTADLGKHIIRVDGQVQHSSINSAFTFENWQMSYSHQWRHHGFGIYGQMIPPNHLISSTSIGLQYGFAFKVGKNAFWRNTKMGLGATIGITQTKSHFSNMVFLDQLIPSGVVRPTGEPPTNGPVDYPYINTGAFLRSKKLFVNFTCNNLSKPKNGFYGTTTSAQEILFYTQAGAKLFEWNKIHFWALADLLAIDNHLKIGLSSTYRHWVATYQIGNAGMNSLKHFIQLGYMKPGIRFYFTYQYFDQYLYTLSSGIAFGISKQ